MDEHDIPFDDSRLKRGFYGRRAGKGLRGRQAELMGDYDEHPLTLSISKPCPQDVKSLFATKVSSVWLESGFGGGEHLVHRAKENPDIGFIGIEPFRNGMARALQMIEEEGLQNIRLYNDEGGPFLDWLPASSLSGYYLLYPDPWPKKRHFKRRFVNTENLKRIQRALIGGSEFRCASDIDSYVEWTIEHCAENSAFNWLNGSEENALTPWDNWPSTRYEAKALREGRTPRYLTFKVNG